MLDYDPGVLPNLPAPSAGESIHFKVEGLPPAKELRRSLRNPSHPRYGAFLALRRAATEAMAGHAWYAGPVGLEVTIHIPPAERNRFSLLDLVGGVMDALDGSHGSRFTYLPIVFEDDCQVCTGRSCFQTSGTAWYEVTVRFLPAA